MKLDPLLKDAAMGDLEFKLQNSELAPELRNEIRNLVSAGIEHYVKNAPSDKVERMEQVETAHGALLTIFNLAGSLDVILQANKNMANAELVNSIIAYLKLIRAQADACYRKYLG